MITHSKNYIIYQYINFLSIVDKATDWSKQDYIYQCRICKEKESKFILLVEHSELVHNIKYKGRAIKNIGLEPDIHDLNFYCQACETTYQSSNLFRSHLRMVHKMLLNSMHRESVLIGTNSDPDDPSLHCISCNYTFSSRNGYRDHLGHKHKVKQMPINRKDFKIKNPDVLPEWDSTENYCRSCEYTYNSKTLYHRHCKDMHLMKPSIERPDWNDPNFYCKICKSTHSSQGTYRKHCRYYHPKYPNPTIINPDVLPDESDPNNYCKLCEKKYTGRCSYRRHLRFTHKMLGSPNFYKKPKDISPDINDRNNYCCSCDKTLSSKNAYKMHLLFIHSIGQPTKKEGN